MISFIFYAGLLLFISMAVLATAYLFTARDNALDRKQQNIESDKIGL